MDNCKIVEDLLPSYCDNLTSPESTALVEAHIARCPCCAGTLVAMKKRQSDQEQEKSREEFRSALRFYESRHKQRILWIALACAILVIVFFVLQAVSMEMALASKGISSFKVVVISMYHHISAVLTSLDGNGIRLETEVAVLDGIIALVDHFYAECTVIVTHDCGNDRNAEPFHILLDRIRLYRIRKHDILSIGICHIPFMA